MMVFSALRPKKLFYLLLFSLFAGILIIYNSTEEGGEEPQNILPVIGVTLPDLNQFDYHSDSATPCLSGKPDILAFVHSSPTHIPHREAIRKTWGSSKYTNIKTVFIVGQSKTEKVWKRVQQEAREYQDVVLLQLTDSYKNLTLKHLLALKWALENCPRVPYILKADDDTFVDTKRLSSTIDLILGENSGSKNSLVCHVIPDGTAPRRTGKWMVTQEEYPYEEYPEYCSGLAYFARLSTVQKIYDVASTGGVPYLRIDDVFITGLAASLAGVRRLDLGVRFANTELPVVEWMKSKSVRPCPWMVAEISSYHWPKEAFRMWNKTMLSWRKTEQRKDMLLHA